MRSPSRPGFFENHYVNTDRCTAMLRACASVIICECIFECVVVQLHASRPARAQHKNGPLKVKRFLAVAEIQTRDRLRASPPLD
jgi:hypothetical protein